MIAYQPRDYLITRVRHRTAQAAGPLARGATLPYTCEAWLIPRARPYRSPPPPKREQPDVIEARLVSNSPYASLDAQGRYKVRTLFEPGLYPFGKPPEPLLTGLRRLTPYAGPRDPFGQPTGWHAPGLDDAPVLLTCLNDDPDQLCVLGGTYHPNQVSPITSANPTEHLYRSASGNTLLMDASRAQ
jgi:type VI secretion system secreted protein VgrG